MPDPRDSPTGRPSLPNRLGWPRLTLAIGGALVAATSIYVFEANEPIFWLEAGLVAIAAALIPIDRVDVHAYVRAALWGGLGLTSLLYLGRSPFVFGSDWVGMAGAAIALLALGRYGLDRDDRGFSPIVLRRTLLTMMVVGLCVAHVLAITSYLAETVGVFFAASGEFGSPLPLVGLRWGAFGLTPLLLITGGIGLSRTRTWGLLSYLGAVFVASAVAAALLLIPSWYLVDGRLLGLLWAMAASALLVAALPVISAMVFRRRPSPQSGGGWGQALHALGVVLVVVAAIALKQA